MQYELETETHHAVGPYPDVYGHGPVTLIGSDIAACLDCGYTVSDIRLLAHADCEREENPINQTWRERLDEYGFPQSFDARSGEMNPGR